MIHFYYSNKTQNASKKKSHHLILGTTTTLWHSPVDILMWHLDTAALAMNAILKFKIFMIPRQIISSIYEIGDRHVSLV